MLRKTIKNIAVLDLQNFTAEALRRIKKIDGCAIILISKNASEEWKNVYANIKIQNVAQIIETDAHKHGVLNGVVTLNDSNVTDDCIYVINGIAVLETVKKIPDLCVNGIIFKRKRSQYNISLLNGRSVELGDEVTIKAYMNVVEIDSDTVRNFDNNTCVVAGNIIDIKNDVTEQMLTDKKITFAAGNKVECNKNISGYVKANSIAGNKITEKNE